MSSVLKMRKGVRNIYVVPFGPIGAGRELDFSEDPAAEPGEPVLAAEEPDREMPLPAEMDAAENAYRSGYAAGVAETEQRLTEDFRLKTEEECQRIELLLTAIGEEHAQWKSRAEKNLIRFAVAVAERIIRSEVSAHPEIILRQIRESFRRIVGVDKVRLRVNPSDEPFVRGKRSEIVGESESVRELLIESDEKVEPGGCILESEMGNIDAQLLTQLQNIEDGLLGQAGR